MASLTIVGLACIALAWGYQLLYLYKKDNQITRTFVLLYTIGVACVVAEEFFRSESLSVQGMVNSISLLLSLTMFLILFFRRR